VTLDEENWTMDVTWKLREDVQWADGEPVTADDVVFTWNAITDPEKGIWVDGVDYTDSVEKVDDFTFVVHYNTVFPGYPTQFGGENFAVYPAHYCDAEQGFTEWDCNRQPLSDGPYTLKEWQTNDYLLFERNPNYYQESKPTIDRIIVKVVPEESVRKTMMLEGDADVNMWLTVAAVDELNGQPGMYVSNAPTQRWVMRLIPNLARRGSIDAAAEPHPIFSDPDLRRAVRMAIDVDTIVEEIFLGYVQPVWTEFFRPPYNVCDIPRPTYDPEGARALLEGAGWVDTDNDGVRECHGCATAEAGKPLSFELMTYAEFGEELELAQQLIGEMLGAAGFEVQLSVIEGAVLWADFESGGIEQNGDFDMNLYDDGYPGTDPTDNMLWYYYHTDAGQPDDGWNVGRWSNLDFDALLDEAYTLDEEYRKEIFCQMAGIMDAELPQILLWSWIEANAFSSRIQGAQSTVNDSLTWNVADWTLGE
jgi:peptide/nickel transport system substrate-binding protein